jgi:hypothetical protein
MDTHEYVTNMVNEMNDPELRTAAIAMLEGQEILDPIFLGNYLANVGLCAEHEGASEIVCLAKAHPEVMAKLESQLDFSQSTIQPDCDEEDFETEAVMRFTDLVDLTGLEPFLSEEKLKELTEMANRNIRLVQANSKKFECVWERATDFRDMFLGDRFGLPRYFINEITRATDWVLRGVDRPAMGDQKIRQLCWNRAV